MPLWDENRARRAISREWPSPGMGPEHVCPLCARLVRPAGDHLPRHLDQTLGVPCRGSGVPLSHDWERDMI